MYSCDSTKLLLSRLRVRPHSALGALADKFEDLIGGPGTLPTLQSPHGSRPPLHVCSDLQDTRTKLNTPPALQRSLVAERLEEMSEFLQVFTDGSVCYNTGTPTAAYHITALGIDSAGRLNMLTSPTTAELTAVRLAVKILLVLSDKSLAVILSDSRSAFQVLLSGENAYILAQEVAGLRLVGSLKIPDELWFFSG